MAGEYFVRLSVDGHSSTLLGHVTEPSEVPDLLRWVAAAMDANPESPRRLFESLPGVGVPRRVAQPFSPL